MAQMVLQSPLHTMSLVIMVKNIGVIIFILIIYKRLPLGSCSALADQLTPGEQCGTPWIDRQFIRGAYR